MPQMLKCATARWFRFGPFLDDIDGRTPETELTFNQEDILLSKDGGAFAEIGTVVPSAFTHDTKGWYKFYFTATDVNTFGPLTVMVDVSGALPVWRDFVVVSPCVYDAFNAADGTNYLDVNIVQVGDSTTYGNNLASACLNYAGGSGLAGSHLNATISSRQATITDLDGKINTIDANIDAILVDTSTTLQAELDGIQADTEDIQTKLAVVDGIVDDILIDTGTTLQGELDGIQADTEDIQSTLGVAGAGLTAVAWNAAWDAEVESEVADALTAYDPATSTELAATDAKIDDIVGLDYTAELASIEGKIDTIDGIVDDILVDTGTTLQGELDGIQADTEDLQAKLAIVDGIVDDILVDTGTTLQGELDGIQEDTEDIQTKLAVVDGIVDDILADTDELQSDDTPGALSAIDAKIDTIDGIVDDILVDTGTTLQAELDGIQADTEDLQAQIGVAGAGLTAVAWNASWDAQVQSEVQDAIEANHLDHLLAVAYDPASKPGDAEALFNELVENDGGVSRFTANALEEAPDTSTGLTLHGDYDAAKTAAQAGDEMTLEDDAITAAKFDESTAYPIASADTGATAVARTGADSDTLEALSDQLDAVTADTNELQTDLTNGGRLDLLIDSILADTNELQADDTPGALAAIDAKIDTIDGIVDDVLADTGTDGVLIAAGEVKQLMGHVGYNLTSKVLEIFFAPISSGSVMASTACTSLIIYNAESTSVISSWDTGPTKDADTGVWMAILDDASGALAGGKAYFALAVIDTVTYAGVLFGAIA